MNYDVIVYGTVCLDLLWRVETLPPPGGYVEILEEQKAIGGEAANTAIALSRWGVRVALVGNPLGADENGRLVRELFRRDAPEVDLQFISTDHATETPYCVCMSTPDGQRTMFGHRFADLQCPPLDPALACAARWFTAEPNAYDSGVRACLAAAEAGLQVLPMDYAREPAVNRVATLVVTSSEHVGRSLPTSELADFAMQVRDADGPTTLVTYGERGCFLAERGQAGIQHIPAYVAPSVIDTTGSGDIFRAGLLYGSLQDWDLVRSIRFAAAAAALNCGALGGWGGVRPLEEILAFQNTAPIHPQIDTELICGSS
ncbi:MAG TPA: carbohydrate kinase family protein [Chthonomonadaceae bacterium]|nr:carbohydrate kinase family protein [Chthonomonadaceae bacterium]